MTKKGGVTNGFVTPPLMAVELLDPDTAVTFSGCQAIGRKQISVRVYLILTHLYY